MLRDIVKIWIVKFGEPPVIRQIYLGFLLYGNSYKLVLVL